MKYCPVIERHLKLCEFKDNSTSYEVSELEGKVSKSSTVALFTKAILLSNEPGGS